MTLVALKNKQTRSSTCETATMARAKQAERVSGFNGRAVQTGLVQTDVTGPAGSDAGVLFSVNL